MRATANASVARTNWDGTPRPMSHLPDIRMAEASDARPLAELAEQTVRATFESMNTPANLTLRR